MSRCECWRNPETGYLEQCKGCKELQSATACDWCGGDFEEGERRFPGYGDKPTHKKCVSEACRAFRIDNGGDSLYDRPEREPFNDWPNGQGTYD